MEGTADTFCEELVEVAPERVINLAGKLSLIESCYAVSKANALVSADTGLIHVADILGVKGSLLWVQQHLDFQRIQILKLSK